MRDFRRECSDVAFLGSPLRLKGRTVDAVERGESLWRDAMATGRRRTGEVGSGALK